MIGIMQHLHQLIIHQSQEEGVVDVEKDKQ